MARESRHMKRQSARSIARAVLLALVLAPAALAAPSAANAQPAAAPATGSPAESDLWGGTRRFAARLSADNQVTLTNSNATATVDMVFDIATKTITWKITHQGLTSAPTAVRLHGPAQPGTNGAALIDLGVNGLQSPITGQSPVTAAQVQYLLLGWTYVSIATRRYPEGEIRGKVDVVPPANYRRPVPKADARATAR